jgi:hypothetical protein
LCERPARAETTGTLLRRDSHCRDDERRHISTGRGGARDAAGNEPTAVYATDYSTDEYEVAERDGRPVVPAPTGAETFGNARELTYVHGSEVRGGMGPALVPFSEGADADAFVSRFGGERIAFDDIDEGFVARYGQQA